MSRIRNPRMVIAILLLSLAAFAAGYLVKSANVAPDMSAQVGQIEGDHDLEEHFDDKGNVIWTCSMHPQIQLPEPGKCPICFMELIPLRREAEGTQASVREITLTDSARKLAGIATEEVRRLDVAVETRMVGKVDYDETRVRNITAWTGGRVDTMYVDYTGSRVRQGQPMVSIYSPELLTAQAELIQAIKAREDLKGSNLNLVKESAKRTEEASREKLRLLGLTQRQIDKVASEGKAADHITLYAPQGGVVIRKDVNEGQYVKTGTSIYSVADLSTLWVVLEAYESDLPWIALGQQVEFQTEAYPGKMFKGKVVYIDPLVSEQTRTVRVRLEVGNRDGSLKPGMLVRATQQKEDGKKTAGESPLVIPASAPLITGKRAVVYVANPDKPGAFEGREIVLGPRAGNHYIVRSGLKEGDLVVTKGNFKIDSAVQIVARPSMMNPTSASSPVSEELPSLFVSKLALLDQSFESLSAAVGTGELDKTHLAFGQFNKDLRLIDGSSLEGVPALRWKEHSMLLGNDAILGAEAADGQRLNKIFAEMQGHYAALRKDFNLGDAQSLTAPEPFRQQLGLVYANYEPLAAALAVDDAEAARKAAARMSESLRLVDESGLSGPAYNVWRDALARMNDGLAAIRDAGDIVGIRTGFDPLSAGLSEAVLKLGVETDGPLFEIFCPMAFDYEGAVWLQRSEEVHNPYFGAAMSTCGEINKQLKR